MKWLNQLSLVTAHQEVTVESIGRAVVVHPLVAETNRAHLNRLEKAQTTAPHAATIRRTAVSLLGAAVEPLRFDNRQHWPIFRALVPHVSELLDSTAHHLDRDSLTQLLTITAKTVAASAWGGAESSAETLANAALARGDRLEPDNPGNLALRNELAWAIGKSGRWREALAALQPVLAGREKRLGANDAATLDTRHKYAWAVGRLDGWPAAERQLRDVLAARTDLLGAEDQDTLHTRCCLLWAISENGRLDEAEAGYLDLFAVRKRVLEPNHAETWDTLHSLAEAYVVHGRHGDAEMLLRDIIAARQEVLGPDYPETLDNRPRYWLACALRGLGRRWRARREFRRLYVDQVRTLGPNHPATQATRQELNRRLRRWRKSMDE